MAFQDSDDEWYPNRLEEISGIMEDRKDIDFIFTYGKFLKNGEIIRDVGRALWANDLSREELVARMFLGNFIKNPTGYPPACWGVIHCSTNSCR